MSISHIAQFGGRIREEEKIVIIRREDNDKREFAPLDNELHRTHSSEKIIWNLTMKPYQTGRRACAAWITTNLGFKNDDIKLLLLWAPGFFRSQLETVLPTV